MHFSCGRNIFLTCIEIHYRPSSILSFHDPPCTVGQPSILENHCPFCDRTSSNCKVITRSALALPLINLGGSSELQYSTSVAQHSATTSDALKKGEALLNTARQRFGGAITVREPHNYMVYSSWDVTNQLLQRTRRQKAAHSSTPLWNPR